jgi:hypothetical protein
VALIGTAIPTVAEKDFFRFYGPEKPFFDNRFKLPDVEKVN